MQKRALRENASVFYGLSDQGIGQRQTAGLGAADPSNPQSWNRYAYVMNDPSK
jgi:hypothetical protein